MSRAARPRAAKHDRDDAGDDFENGRNAVQKRVRRFHISEIP